jgi:purine nucleosidase/pyrimidine-specific ribonucleoside hydrolase
MKRKLLIAGGIVLGLCTLSVILVGPAAPLLVQLGVEPVCIQGELPDLRLASCPDSTGPGPSATALPLPPLADSAPIPIIFDDDGSPDGMIALLYLLSHPHYDVQAVTVSCGEAHPERFAPHVARLLAAVGRPEIPVGVGRSTPLAGDNAFPEPWRASSDAFWDLSLPDAPSAPDLVPASELIVELLAGADRETSIFLGGPHTNLADALRMDPGIRGNIRDVHAMGGSINVQGNIESDWPEIHNQVAEWNIWVDPVAAQEVFASGLPLWLMPLDGTNQVTWTRADVVTWHSAATPESELAADLLDWMLTNWSEGGVYIWDLAAAVATADPRLCPQVAYSLDVATEPGPEQGRTFIADGAPTVTVCLEPDPAQVKARAAWLLGE